MRRFIAAIFIFILPVAHGFGEISTFIDFTEIIADKELRGRPVHEATLFQNGDGYRSYLPGEWSVVPYKEEDHHPISVKQTKYYDTFCMRVTGNVDLNSTGFFLYPPFPPDLTPERLEITDSGAVTQVASEYEWRSRFENYGLIHHAGQIQGAEMMVRNVKDPVKITVIVEDNRGHRAGIPFDVRFSGDGFITLRWENSLRDLWVGKKDNLYQYIRLVGIQVESLTLTDFLRERYYLSKILTEEEVWEMRKQDEKTNKTSSILLDINSINLIYGDHYWEPWEPKTGIGAVEEELY
jgi:hypothetical protein